MRAHARDQLAAELPPYMVPASIVRLEAMPLTPNGKVDRSALPEPATDDSIPRPLAPPRDEVERRLVEIWKELLSIDSVGVHDSFFELGGHSLLAVRMVDRIGQAFKQSLPLAKLFTRRQSRNWPRSSIGAAAGSMTMYSFRFVPKANGLRCFASPAFLTMPSRLSRFPEGSTNASRFTCFFSRASPPAAGCRPPLKRWPAHSSGI